MKEGFMFAVGFFLMVILSSLCVLATIGPAAYLTEQVRADYHTNGTLDTGTNWTQCEPDNNPCRYGYLEVGVPNTQDVLQYIRINITDTTFTNLSSKTAYKGALASPGSNWERNKIYFNSSADNDLTDDDRYYNLTNSTKAPTIKLSLTYSNDAGGNDFYDEDNIEEFVTGYTSRNNLSFTLTLENPSAEQTLNGVNVTLQFDTDTGPGGEDVVNVTSTSGTSEDTDYDGHNDKVTWSGNLGTLSSADITIAADLEETVNLPDDTDSVNLDSQASDKGAEAKWSNTTEVFTEKTITGKFSKGPIRQGTDLSNTTAGWKVRGFIRNLGNASVSNNLTHNVTEWALWNVSADGSLDTKVQPGTFDPPEIRPGDGRIYTTNNERSNDTSWYETGKITKPYYATQFTWEVVWNSSSPDNYYAYINTSLDLPVLYKIDLVNSKTISGVLTPETSGENITITDETQHQGSDKAPAERVEILSVVPGENNAGATPEETGLPHFTINETKNVTVYFYNGSYYKITNGYEVDFIQPTAAGADGLVNVTVPNTSAVPTISHYLNETESIKIKYDVYTNATTNSGDKFSFTGNSSMTTQSGTPITEVQPTQTIVISAKRLTGYKDLIAYDPTQPTLINGTIVINVIDTSNASTGIDEIKFIDYVPRGTDFNVTNVTFNFNDTNTDKTPNSEGKISGYLCINDTGLVTLPGGEKARAYEYMKNCTTDTGWHLYDGDWINASYQINITTSGLYEVPTTLIGVDPTTGVSLGTSLIGVVDVIVPKPLKKLEITQGDLEQAKRVTVGNPGEWLKKFEVFNPNPRSVEGEFETTVFKDAGKGWITYTDREGNLVRIEGRFEEKDEGRVLTWKDKINPLGTRSYEVSILTPPVLETDRDVKVLEQISNKRVKLKMDVFLKNFAQEKYENVVLNLPIPYQNIVRVRDGFGNPLRFTGGGESTSVIVGEMSGKGMKTVSIIYKQPYPTIIVTPEKDTYTLAAPVNISILVINGGQSIKYPKIETEIYAPGMEAVKTEIKELEELEPLEKTKLTERYVLPVNLPTGEYVAYARFRENFATLATGAGKFYVKSSFGAGGRTAPAVILLVAIIGVGYLSYERLKEIKR